MDFKVRCSGISQIMTNPKLKRDKEAGNLSATCKSHLKDWYNYNKYGRRNQIETAYTKKGIYMEDDSITLLAQVYKNLGIPFKNEERKTDEYKTGECDLYFEELSMVRDIKTSWDIHTFPGGPFGDDKLSKAYFDQMQGYLDLWDAENGFVDYCLIDTPVSLIDSKLYKLNYKFEFLSLDYDQNTGQKYVTNFEIIPMIVEVVKNAIYTADGLQKYIDDSRIFIKEEWFTDFKEIPQNERIKTYEVKRDREYCETIHDRVRQIRNYLKSKNLIIQNKAA